MNLEEFFSKHNKVALGFSGGVDSTYLLYAGKKYGADISAYFIKSQFQPAFELEDAYKLADYIGVSFKIIDVDILKETEVSSNPKNRCYFCKQKIFGALREAANRDGYDTLIDGTNASDDYNDRPGMKALTEMNVLSPLRICSITKADVRNLSKAAGLFTWMKPSYACLATRIPACTEITAEILAKVENAENVLTNMGFQDFRVRIMEGYAKLQVREEDFPKVIQEKSSIKEALSDYFDEVLLDLKGREYNG